MELEGSGTPQASNLYKIINLRDRNPGASETFFFRYVGIDENGGRIVSNRSAAVQFDNNGLTLYEVAPTISVTAQSQSYTVSWDVPNQATFPNYLYTEVYESKTLSTAATFNTASLSSPNVSPLGSTTANSRFVFTGIDYDLRYVRVRHVGKSNGFIIYSPLSNIVSVTPLTLEGADTTPPDSPSTLTVTGYNDQTDRSGQSGYVLMSWAAATATDVEAYYVRYGTSTLDTYVFYGAGVNSGRIDNLRAGQTYYFQIASTDGSNQSAYIPETPVSATIPADQTAPGAPSGLAVVAGFNNIIAYWNRNSEGDVDLGRGTYQFQIDDNNDFSSLIQDRTITGTVASFTGLTTGTTYYVRVRAIDSSGNASPWSATGSATPGKINAELAITSGTIVGDLVAANTIVGDKLIANTIDADRLKTNTGIVGKLFVGDDAGSNKITIDGTATTPAVYYGTGNYNNADTPFYFDALGKFSLKDQLSWNGATLVVKGQLDVTQASTFGANVLVSGSGSVIVGDSSTANNRIELTSGALIAYIGGVQRFTLNGNATSGKITMSIGSMNIGEDVGGSGLDGLHINNTNYIYDDGSFKLANGKITWTGSALSVTGDISGSSFSTTDNIIRINNSNDNKITFTPPGLSSGVLEVKDYATSGLGYLYLGAPYNSTYGLQPFLKMQSLSDTPYVQLSSITGTVELTGNIVNLSSGSIVLNNGQAGGTTNVAGQLQLGNFANYNSGPSARLLSTTSGGEVRRGRLITHSTSAPSGGVDGDIHFQL